MDMHQPDPALARIILKSATGSLTPEEETVLLAYLQASAANRAQYESLVDTVRLQEKLAHYHRSGQQAALHFDKIRKATRPPAKRFYMFQRFRWAVAVLLVLISGSLLYFILHTSPAPTPAGTAGPAVSPVQPGKPGAILKLADGSEVVLDSLGNGLVASQQGARVVLENGELAYEKDGKTGGDIPYNELATPKGREFALTLPDGTRVWLNSGSSIRFPVRFEGRERLVQVTGEVYFEVATAWLPGKKERSPFRVAITTPGGTGGIVEVLGTHFNINAYAAETISTTLLEGSVRVSSNTPQGTTAARSLRPGQQARQTGSQLSLIPHPDIDKVMAWRRGFFNFDNASLDEVMNELARWYDLEVEYKAGIPAIQFQGELSRRMQLSSVLKALEESKVHFELQGRKMIILPAP